jgi:hypothetical protein
MFKGQKGGVAMLVWGIVCPFFIMLFSPRLFFSTKPSSMKKSKNYQDNSILSAA